jgi:hypothetical protein
MQDSKAIFKIMSTAFLITGSLSMHGTAIWTLIWFYA